MPTDWIAGWVVRCCMAHPVHRAPTLSVMYNCILNPEDGESVFRRNVRTYLRNDMTSHPTRHINLITSSHLTYCYLRFRTCVKLGLVHKVKHKYRGRAQLVNVVGNKCLNKHHHSAVIKSMTTSFKFYTQWSMRHVMCVNNYPTRCNNIQVDLYLQIPLHVSGGISTYYQELISLYLQQLAICRYK